jgi:hypothetical protein
VNADVLSAGISAYLLLGLLWAAAYLLLAELTPEAFSLINRAPGAGPMDRFGALHFSFVTLTCLGCNDIVPVSRVAQMLLMVEATMGVLYLAVMIARLVALYSRPNLRETACLCFSVFGAYIDFLNSWPAGTAWNRTTSFTQSRDFTMMSRCWMRKLTSLACRW